MPSVALRRSLFLALGAMIVLGGIRLPYLQALVIDLDPLRAQFRDYPDQTTTEYPRFLESVARVTPPGARIAIMVPMRHWDGGYSYAYYRASYFLAGREVLPLIWSDDRAHPENLARADYIASWGWRIRPAGFRIVAAGQHGELFRRVD